MGAAASSQVPKRVGGCVVRLSNWAAAQLEEGEDQGKQKDNVLALRCVSDSDACMQAFFLSTTFVAVSYRDMA
jgi:hypothetical protein